jgi:hypothetical protein
MSVIEFKKLTLCCVAIVCTTARLTEATAIVAPPMITTDPSDAPTAASNGFGIIIFK